MQAADPVAGTADGPAEEVRPPRWIPLAGLVLALAGLGVATYLTIAHYTQSVSLACPDTGLVNCQRVTTSEQSKVFGIPVALLGLLFYAGMVALTVPPAWAPHRPLFGRLRLAGTAVAVAFVCYLVYVELFVVDAICLWCTAVHVLTLALFILVALSAALYPQRR